MTFLVMLHPETDPSNPVGFPIFKYSLVILVQVVKNSFRHGNERLRGQ